MSTLDLRFAPVKAEEIEYCHELEKKGYPPDEAASLEAFRYRQAHAPDLFIGAYLASPDDTNTQQRQLIGYACGTLATGTSLPHGAMAAHDPRGTSVCVHAVCVADAYRRQGVGLSLLRNYIARMVGMAAEAAEAGAEAGVGVGDAKGAPRVERILLLSHEELVPFYESAGFERGGKSTVKHGNRDWIEMRKELRERIELAEEEENGEEGAGVGEVEGKEVQNQMEKLQLQEAPPPPPDTMAMLWEALAKQSNKIRPTGVQLREFADRMKDVAVAVDVKGEHGVRANKYKILCPRSGCGSLLLKENTAKWERRPSVKLDLESVQKSPVLEDMPPPEELTDWWLVGPTPMAFENIGFSRPVVQAGGDAHEFKLLACAECNLGPLGYHFPGESEFLLASNRVSYLVPPLSGTGGKA